MQVQKIDQVYETRPWYDIIKTCKRLCGVHLDCFNMFNNKCLYIVGKPCCQTCKVALIALPAFGQLWWKNFSDTTLYNRIGTWQFWDCGKVKIGFSVPENLSVPVPVGVSSNCKHRQSLLEITLRCWLEHLLIAGKWESKQSKSFGVNLSLVGLKTASGKLQVKSGPGFQSWTTETEIKHKWNVWKWLVRS